MKQHDRILAARIQLLMSQHGAFWGPLVTRLEPTAVPMNWHGVWAMATDGRHLYYVDETVAKWSMQTICAVIAHEVMHCALLHPYRISARPNWDQKFGNYCMDLVINPQLKASGFTLPEQAVFDTTVDGESETWEQVYMRLNSQQQQQKGGKGQSGPGSGDFGGVLDPTTLGEGDGERGDGQDSGSQSQQGPRVVGISPQIAAQQAQEWEAAMCGAVDNLSKKLGQGNMPAWMQLRVGEILKPKVDWRSKLWEYLTGGVEKTQTWARPNRNHLPRGLYMPGMFKDPMAGKWEVWVDTSGSLYGRLDEVAAELRGILEAMQPEEVVVGYIDARIGRIDKYSRDELDQFEVRMVGGGGTDFRPAFEWREREEAPDHMIYITDLYGTFPEKAPHWPVTWVHIQDRYCSYPVEVPFGKVIEVQE